MIEFSVRFVWVFACIIAGLQFCPRMAIGAEQVWVEKTIRFSLTVRNQLSQRLSGERLLVYGPAQTSNQEVLGLEASTPFRLEKDKLGNHLMVFELDELAPYATLRISITGHLRLAESAMRAREEPAPEFLMAETYVEADHPDILDRSRNLRPQGADSDFVRRVFDWTRGYMRYAGYSAADFGALHALKSRSGDCSEYAYLVTALSRAQQIPARVLGGFVVPVSAVVKAADYHNWSEVFFDGRWQIVDAQRGVFMDRNPDYVVTRVVHRGEARFDFFHRYKSPGGRLEVEMD